jgi:hypothetical protein
MYKCKYDIEEEENVQHEHKKAICDYFTGPKKRKIGMTNRRSLLKTLQVATH